MKPMLCATVADVTKLRYPYLASPKLDGIRCLIVDGVPVSRNLKPIRNKYIANALRGLPPLDGELIVGSPTAPDCFNRTSSGVMSADGEPDFKYYVFDSLSRLPFVLRLSGVNAYTNQYVTALAHETMSCHEHLIGYEARCLHDGYEGIILRDPEGMYKFGRATPNENSLWKLKRFEDGELMVTGVLEGQSNENPATPDALGETTRSTHKENMVPNGKVGTILGYDMQTKASIDISPGKMPHDMRRALLERPEQIVGKIIKYKWFKYGSIDAPRFATFQGFRDPADMS